MQLIVTWLVYFTSLARYPQAQQKNITNLNHKIRLYGIKAISVIYCCCYRFDSPWKKMSFHMKKIKSEKIKMNSG